ncbi:anti-sigma factor family protein [Pseudarthrobacter sp. CC4]|uniref:anti-sigma factor family protein n=1 Tax=Pseudarthrobacter sp. CC4 TaxID=3029190 RepID=UPI003BA32C05
MVGANGTDAYLEWTAAYVLGSLDPLDRRAFEKHIVECSNCAAAVNEFAALPALLSTLPDADALTLGRGGTTHAPPEWLRTLADKIRRRRRRPTA